MCVAGVQLNAIEEASIRKECGIEFKALPEGRMHKAEEKSTQE